MSRVRLHLLLDRLSHVLREDLREAAGRYDLALAQLEVLHYLAVANRFSDTLSAVVEYVGATKGTTSQTLAALVRKGLVARRTDPTDGRVQHCVLTPRGQAIVDESRPASALRGVTLPEDAALALESALRSMITARGGRAFGVCGTCAHHERSPGGGGRCLLLGVPLDEADVDRLCREHTPP